MWFRITNPPRIVTSSPDPGLQRTEEGVARKRVLLIPRAAGPTPLELLFQPRRELHAGGCIDSAVSRKTGTACDALAHKAVREGRSKTIPL